MAKILAFAGSNSSTSINYQFVKYTTSFLEGHEVRLLNMANYPFPMYSEDVERKEGYSNSLVELKNEIQKFDGLIIAANEHNGNPSAYLKNVLDWLSRLERRFMEGKKVLLMSTSKGKRGGIGALEAVEGMLPRFGAEIVATFSLPSYAENFNGDDRIMEKDLLEAHNAAVSKFLSAL